MRQESVLDPRFVAKQAQSYLESTSIGDGISLRASCQFQIERKEAGSTANGLDVTGLAHATQVSSPKDPYLVCGPEDVDFELRCDVANTASECGLQIDRHFRASEATSELSLRPSGSWKLR